MDKDLKPAKYKFTFAIAGGRKKVVISDNLNKAYDAVMKQTSYATLRSVTAVD